MRLKLARLVQKSCTLLYTNPWCMLCFLRITFDFTTAGDWDKVLEVGHIPVLPYSVDFIFLFFGAHGFNPGILKPFKGH